MYSYLNNSTPLQNLLKKQNCGSKENE